MNEVIRAAAELQAICIEQDWQFCFIGGLAVQRWGEPRETVNVDLTLLTGFGGEEQFIQILLQRFQGRIPEAAQFARSAASCFCGRQVASVWMWLSPRCRLKS